MRIIRSKIVVFSLAAILSAGSLTAWGKATAAGYEADYLDRDGPDGGDMVADALVARPLTFVASVVGAAAWIVSLPFTLVGGNAGEAGKELVVRPLTYTFARPLGHMDEGRLPTYVQKKEESQTP